MPTQPPLIQIEPAKMSDCAAIAAVHVEAWRVAYQHLLPAEYLSSLSVEQRASMWQQILQKGTRVLVARRDGAVVGFVAFGSASHESPSSECLEMWALYVQPTCWSMGVGCALWLAALTKAQAQGCRSIALWVAEHNDRAIAFYRRAGLVPDSVARKQTALGDVVLDEARYIYRVSIPHDAIRLRCTTPDDKDFVFASYKATLRPYVEWAWGWDEAFQLAGFWKHHPLGQLQLIDVNGERAGALHVEDHADLHYVRMIFLLPAFQRRGVGAQLLLSELTRARQLGKPLHLKVIKINPAKRLYERLGFTVIAEDESTYLMRLQ